MAKKSTLEERAAKKFPCPSDASDKERSSILAMQKAWIRVEQVRQEEQEKKKRQADRDALKLGKELQQRYPGTTLRVGGLMTEEQEYKQYIYNNLIIQICESLNICSREFFIIKYDLSLDEINHIDDVFKEIVTKNILDYTIFKNKIQEGIPRFNSDDVFQKLLESYKFHQPISQKIKSNQ